MITALGISPLVIRPSRSSGDRADTRSDGRSAIPAQQVGRRRQPVAEARVT